MDWRVISLFPLVMWALYSIFASLASNAHGEKVTMVFEALAMVVVAVIVIIMGGISDFGRVTKMSCAQASIMGLMSAGGIAIQFYAFRIAPVEKQGSVVMITCMFPILAVAMFHFMSTFKIAGGSACTTRQWIGVALGAIALWLISGK